MDELAEKREARRRRILENSQRRLEKITGTERKAPALTFPNICNEPDAVSNNRPCLKDTNESPTLPTPQVESLAPRNKRRERIIIIAALALFVNYYTIILKKLFESNEELSVLKSIFVPILTFEAIDFLSSQSQAPTFNLLEQILGQKDPRLVPILRSFVFAVGVMQDVLLYFFVFVCCFMVIKFMGIKTS